MKKALMIATMMAALGASAAVPFKIGIAGFTFRRQNLDTALETMKKIDCHYLCHKDMFLKYDATQDEIDAYKAKTAAAKVETLATGPLYADSETELRKQFEFAKKFGIKVLVGVPFEKAADGKTRVESDAMLDIVDRLVKEYDVRYAIHNHGPDMPKLFPSAEAAMKRIGSRDSRIGVCLDIGHEWRAGCDPVAFIRASGDRIYDVHLKNINTAVLGKNNHAMQGPRGGLDIPSIFAALANVGYAGVCHIEYERDFTDNAMGLAESFGYYRGIAQMTKTELK